MNTRAFTLALIIAGFSIFMMDTYIKDKEAAIKKNFGTPVPVVIAKVNIKELELIDDSKIDVITVPPKFVLPGAFKDKKDLENTVATVPILAGEQISKPRVTYPGAKTGLSRQVSNGRRAMAINITEKQAASKLIKPGDRVDVIAAIDYSSGRKDLQKVKTILQDVIVLSTGMSMTNSIPIFGVKTPTVIKKMNVPTYTKYNTVTLELDPYQVQKIIFLLNYSGHPLFLSLRNNNDKKKTRIQATDIFDVIGEDETQKAKGFFADKYKKK